MHVMKKGNNNINNKPFFLGLIVGGLLGLTPGFGLGVYFLPIIVAERGADETVLNGADASAAIGQCQSLSGCACLVREVFNVHQFGTIKMTV